MEVATDTRLDSRTLGTTVAKVHFEGDKDAEGDVTVHSITFAQETKIFRQRLKNRFVPRYSYTGCISASDSSRS